MPSLFSVIHQASLLIASLWAKVQTLSQKVKDLEAQLFQTTAAKQANQAVADAAATEQSDLAAAGADLANVISTHPDIALTVDPVTLVPTPDVPSAEPVAPPVNEPVAPPAPADSAAPVDTAQADKEAPAVAPDAPPPEAAPES